MSYAVTALVRAMRLPATVRRRCRTGVKAVLLALADRCDDHGTYAFPSVATIAAEAEIGLRTVDRHLELLVELGLISEEAPARQHRPRIWQLHLDAIRALVPGSPNGSRQGRQIESPRVAKSGLQGRQIEPQGRQIGAPGSPKLGDRSYERYVQNGGSAAAPRARPLKAPYGSRTAGNVDALRAFASRRQRR